MVDLMSTLRLEEARLGELDYRERSHKVSNLMKDLNISQRG